VLSGRRLADYELGAPLGEDGFGPIFEALHLNLRRTFALRVLSDQFTFAQGFEERFWRVTRVLATLDHTNLLTLDDYGIDGPYAYLVTPFVEGLTLDAWLRQRPGQPVGPAQVLRLFGQMLAGLGHAHQASVTHLGLTPRHILIQPNGHLLIANFGLPYLAEQLWIAWNGSRSFGDPLYLAPEQIPGRTPSGVAADLYALGIILYRLLAGALPFEGPPQTILGAKLEGPPPLRAKNPDLPAPLEAVVRRALAPSPEERWASVAEFGRAFYQALGQANQLSAQPRLTGGPERPALLSGSPPPLLMAPDGDVPGGSAPYPSGSFVPAALPPGPGEPVRAAYTLSPPPENLPPAGPPALKGGVSPILAWSSAGKGRVSLPPPPPGWRPDGTAPQPPPPASRGGLPRLLSTILKLLVLLVTLAVLGVAIFYGYHRWVQIQQQMTTPTPIVTPGHTHSLTPTPKHKPERASQDIWLIAGRANG
jgi:serine/threonine-protein kinase